MRNLLILVLLNVLVKQHIKAQCIPAIPFNSVVVNSTQTINGGFDPIWVCSGDTLHSDGGFHKIFLEPGSVMTTSGGIDSIYVKEGAQFFMNGGIHVIYYVDPADLSIAGGIPYQNSCSSIQFDYSTAPSNGCALSVIAAFASSDSVICTGDCIDFESLSLNATSWQWQFPGANPVASSAENPEAICYPATGSYDVTLIAGNGSSTDTMTIEGMIISSPPPVPPVLTQNEDTLFATQGYATYQWYFEGLLINGATGYFYVASQTGIYSVVVTSFESCGSASTEIPFVFTGLPPISDHPFLLIFPNPAARLVTIQLQSDNKTSGTLSIADGIGRLVKTMPLDFNAGQHEIRIDVSNLPSAIYYIEVETAGSSSTKKLIVCHE